MPLNLPGLAGEAHGHGGERGHIPAEPEDAALFGGKSLVLAGNLSLKLHLENSYLAFERVVRCGGLLGALPPEIASQHGDPQSQQSLLECRGFNNKNSYTRNTPCDQDTLRKGVKDVPAQQWMDWFNGPVQPIFQAYGFFDPAGIFVGDGSYLFVPDNPAYEGSVVMWFDAHHHPVEYEKLRAG